MHTRFWDPDHEKFPLSRELDEKIPKLLFGSDDRDPENGDPKLNRPSVSELLERRGTIFISWLSNEAVVRSVLGIPELTNDISVTAADNSLYDLFETLLLVNGDL